MNSIKNMLKYLKNLNYLELDLVHTNLDEKE